MKDASTLSRIRFVLCRILEVFLILQFILLVQFYFFNPEGETVRLLFPMDAHTSPRGHRLIANEVHKFLQAQQ